MSTKRQSSRRSFFAKLATGTAAVAVGSLATHLDTAEARGTSLLGAESADWDERWLMHLTGKHKQYFDATSVNDGFPMGFAMNFLNLNNEAYKLSDNNLSAVVGLRHFSIPIAFTDGIWSRYKVGEFFKLMDPATKAPATRNYFYNSRPGDVMFPGMAVEKLQARGVMFMVCNVALTVISGLLAKNAGVTPEAAHKEWVAGLIPGMTLVPAGVLAVNRAQEKGCTYCYAG